MKIKTFKGVLVLIIATYFSGLIILESSIFKTGGFNMVIQPREMTNLNKEYKEIEVLTTAYSEFDSCHTGASCLMANGEKAHKGAVACNFLPLGTEIEIAGEKYIVKDRHAKWLNPRIDIFMGYGQEAYDKAINYGKRIKTIIINQ